MPSPSRYVVGGIIGAALLAFAYYSLGFHWGLAAIAVFLYEGWTLINRWPNDTISEVVWELSRRPMVPFMFGVASGWALGSGLVTSIWVASAWFFLMGHFFFQREDGR